MHPKLAQFSKRYLKTLQAHLRQLPPRAGAHAATGLGRRALAIGLETLDLARVHEQAVGTALTEKLRVNPGSKLIRQAGIFFAGVMAPVEESHRGAVQALQLSWLNQELEERTARLDSSSRQLKAETAYRLEMEGALRTSEQHSRRSLDQSRDLQEQLRQLSHQILSVQEEERKRISRELHDEIVQTLTGINLRLANLKAGTKGYAKDLQTKIASTQRLVEQSVEVVHRFARDLRPTVLDDFGLIPALHSFMKEFTKRTGIRIDFTAFRSDRSDELDGARRTVLYRVAQEALTNVARHANATYVTVMLQKLPGAIHMAIADDGKGFAVEGVWLPKPHRGLGVLGMRERLQMVGGQFQMDSAPGEGTRIQATIPMNQESARRKKAHRLVPDAA